MTAIKTLAAVTTVQNDATPFLTGQPVVVFCTTGTPTIYKADHPGRNSAKYLEWQGDGATEVWDEDDFAALADVHVDTGSLAAADTLRVIAMHDGVVLKRVASGSSPSTGEFKTSTETAKATITFGDQNQDGKFEVLILDAADISDTGALTANIRLETTSSQFMLASTLAYLEKTQD